MQRLTDVSVMLAPLMMITIMMIIRMMLITMIMIMMIMIMMMTIMRMMMKTKLTTCTLVHLRDFVGTAAVGLDG